MTTAVASTMLVLAPAAEAQSGRSVTVNSNGLSRGEVHATYYDEFVVSGPPSASFTGNAATCNAGTVSTSYLNDQVDRINWFRLMAGVDADLTLDTSLQSDAQDAALIAARNSPLTHQPARSSACYSSDGAELSGLSNLHQVTGVGAINGYMHDYGSSNQAVGHRRWLLNANLGSVAIGEVPDPSAGTNRGGHAVSVLTDTGDPAALDPEAVVWPPAGFVPTSTVYPRWSISVDDANFGSASVSVRRNGVAVSTSVVFRTSGTAATRGPSPTLTFELGNAAMPSDTADTTYQVTVSNVATPNGTTSYSWTTTAFNAQVSPPSGSVGVGAQVTSGGTLSADLVNATYLDLVGRTATTAEVRYWQSTVGNTGDRSQLVSSLAMSDTWIRSVIDDLYLKALDRGADSGGLAFWTGEIRRGVPVRDVAARFYSSPEYVQASGTTSQWISRLYDEVLGRTADSAGLRFWINETNRTSHVEVALRFYQSTESRQTRVDALYLTLLDRSPDPAGRDFWVGQLMTMDDIALATFLASSAEYGTSNS